MKRLLLLFAFLIIYTFSFAQTADTTITGRVVSKAPDATIVSYKWTKISGPNQGTITNPDAATTTMTGLVTGVYVVEFSVTDNYGMVGKAQKKITVLRYAVAPVADAGPDIIIQLGKPQQ